ncbi:MAG: aldose 1-epimerase [Alphaproteobacteria bacterium]
MEDELITLASGRSRFRVAPAAGGSVTRYWREGESADTALEWFRPAAPEDMAARAPTGMACFPLVPYSNRIREGRFTFGGRRIALPLNFAPQRHALHGHGWQRPWVVAERVAARLVLDYVHGADDWPFPYRARQTFALADDALAISLAVENTGTADMPVGLGLHPYFIRTPEARLTAAVEGMWLTDAEVMPTQHAAPPPPDRDPGRGIVLARVALDNGYTGWRRRARIAWPEWNARLDMEATAPLAFLVVYSPPDEDIFCVEPVSHMTDAFNRAAGGERDTGMMVIAPGEVASATITFTPGEGRAA